MKVLMINHSDASGGAARAAYRLHKGLCLKGIDSQMLVQQKLSGDAMVSGPATKFQKATALARQGLDGLPLELYRKKTKSLFSPAWVPFSGILKKIQNIDPDIVHLHWVAGGMLRVEDLALIKKPVLWSLHDMWAFTGGCHTDEDCGKYTANCGKCPVLGSNIENDLSRSVFKHKKEAYGRMSNLTVVGLSRWSADCARKSRLLGGNRIEILPNPIDLSVFRPMGKNQARDMLNLPKDKKLICFGALDALVVPNKGFGNLSASLERIRDNDIELVIFGGNRPADATDFSFPVHYLGRLYDDLSLRVLYSAVDLTVVPSFQENLSNVIMESLACGSPVAAFNIGGNSDMIVHKENGYLAEPYEPQSLAEGISWILRRPNPALLSEKAVRKVKSCFEIDKVSGQYKTLYEEIIN